MARRRTRSWSAIIPTLIILAILGACGIFAVNRDQREKEKADQEQQQQQQMEQDAAEAYHEAMRILDTEGFSVSSDATKAVTLTLESESAATGTYSKDYIPDSHAAEKAKEARYLIRIVTGKNESGKYNDASKAYRHWADITVEDMLTGKTLAFTMFKGANPPEYKSGSGDYHTYPNDEEISAWVQKVLDRNPSVIGEFEKVFQEYEDAVAAANELLAAGNIHSRDALDFKLLQKYFSAEAIAYAIENCATDWYAHALISANDTLGYSLRGVRSRLKELRFLPEEIDYAVENCELDYMEQAITAAQRNDWRSESYEAMIRTLIEEGFTRDQAVYGADHCGLDWFNQARLFAADHCQHMTREEALAKLLEEDFTQEQAEYAVDKLGLQ